MLFDVFRYTRLSANIFRLHSKIITFPNTEKKSGYVADVIIVKLNIFKIYV